MASFGWRGGGGRCGSGSPAGVPLRLRLRQWRGATMRRTFEVRRETSEQPDGQARWTGPTSWCWGGRREQHSKGRLMRVALYVRVSTDRQQQAQTIEQQVTQLRTYVSVNDRWTIAEAHTFRDDGYSGAKLSRPGLDALRDH